MAISVPSSPVTATKGAATAPNLPGPPGSEGQGEEHGDAVHRVGQGIQVHGQPVVGRRLPGHLESGYPVRRGVGDPLGAPDRAPLVPERGPGHDG